ncbi:hypothetical protein EYC84_008399 [Monilinia fructicola]|uniref:Uncharacterized protein n=1 Tax=Monilinia fructicola TaxID=38448 RepID=A0A5M9JEG7_MONFR|nr:hypothetical protein EYC84_008399 [Monilinia fructicola]
MHMYVMSRMHSCIRIVSKSPTFSLLYYYTQVDQDQNHVNFFVFAYSIVSVSFAVGKIEHLSHYSIHSPFPSFQPIPYHPSHIAFALHLISSRQRVTSHLYCVKIPSFVIRMSMPPPAPPPNLRVEANPVRLPPPYHRH